MSENLVSQPPLSSPIAGKNGELTRPWSIWMRDLYKRTSYKGGNAIDDNKTEIDDAFIDVDATLDEVIDQVIINVENIQFNEQSLTDHENEEEAHGANGKIVGVNDVAEVLVAGLVKKMVIVSDAVDSSISVDAPDATISTVSISSPSVVTAPAAYDQSFTNTIVTLINELKLGTNQIVSDVNPSATLGNELKEDVAQLVLDLNASIAQLNELLANSKTSGQMET